MKSIILISSENNIQFPFPVKKTVSLSLMGNILRFALAELPSPSFDALADSFKNKVLVRKIGFSINFRDRGFLLGCNRNIEKSESKKDSFFGFGSDFVGEVVQVGKGVTSLKIGDRVIPNGNYPGIWTRDFPIGLPTNHASNEFEIFHERQMVLIPQNFNTVVASGFTVGSQTSYAIKERLNLISTDRVLITSGTSNTALFCLSAIRNSVSQVSIITSQPEYSDRLATLGANDIFIITERKNALSSNNKAGQLLKDKKFDIIIDPFFDVYFSQLVKLVDIGGKYITCGFFHQGSPQEIESINGLDLIANLLLKNLSIIGNCLGTTNHLLSAIEHCQAGNYRVEIDSIYSGLQFDEFLKKSLLRKDRFGKVVYFFNEADMIDARSN